MTSSSEIHVQEVLKNLNNLTSIKHDGNLDGTLTAAIAQHTTAQVQSSSLQQAQVEHNQNHVNLEELERIAQEHKQQQQHQEDQQSSSKDHVPALSQEQLEQPLPASVQENTVIQLDPSNSSTLATVPITAADPILPTAKPVPGSEEWHKMRRDNHKEVERRRRETINAGINDLAACIPNPDKNKGQILRQAVKYIQSIQDTHQKLLGDHEALAAMQFEREKALIEKNVAQTQLQTLIAEHDQLKRDYETLRKEVDELAENKKRQRTE
ncbi:basic helix-loop-helix protein [Mortierella sp. NVP85]|nr:basic helix-loop-helix protein [Mortierella sp. NVP85]